MESDIVYNIYCDESCHLLNDQNSVFVLGALWVPKSEVPSISKTIRSIKINHGLSPTSFEIKWTKISPAKSDFYIELLDYFFNNDNLNFRAVVVPDKSILNHQSYSQNHDTWYYKMFYLLLSKIIDKSISGSKFNLFLDIKDTRSNGKIKELWRILNIANSNESQEVILAQQIRSHESELMQINDMLIGALSYYHRGLDSNEGKKQTINSIIDKIGERGIKFTSPIGENKFNVLVWRPNK